MEIIDTGKKIKILHDSDRRVLAQYGYIYLEYSLIIVDIGSNKVDDNNMLENLNCVNQQTHSHEFDSLPFIR